VSFRVPSHRTFAAAYPAIIRDVLDSGEDVPPVCNPTSIGSRFGAGRRSFRELAAYAFAVERPDACLLRAPTRAMNLEYALAQWTWTMAGSDDVAAISYYNPRGWDFTEDRHSLRGAFGHRLRRAEGVDQLDRILDRLRRDSASRREVAIVSLPSDLKSDFRDQPCLVSLQFLLRAGALDLIVTMRSQSAALVLPYDASLFMMLQCWMASALGATPGRYLHFSGSLHIYEDELEMARAIVASPVQDVSIGAMPDARSQTEELVAFESKLRSAVLAMDREHVGRLARTLPDARGDFFADTRRLFTVGAARRLGCEQLQRQLLVGLPRGWRTLLDDLARRPSRSIAQR
jgi:thymidylate synthase